MFLILLNSIVKRRLHLAPPFLVDETFEPIAQRTYRSGKLKDKVVSAQKELLSCKICPRNCGVNRMKNKKGVCNTGRKAIVSSAFSHFGEESVLQGWKGSGTIFFGLCNLRCVFCQNWDISQKKNGWELSGEEIADLMLKLQNETNCHNINFVTPERVAPQVVEAIYFAVEGGLRIPIVYNTSSYDSMASLKLMEGLVDIYMPDFKFWSRTTSKRLCKAEDYPDVAKKTIKEMHRQVGPLVFDSNGLAKRGLLLRHLLMPNHIDEAIQIFKFISKDISKDTYIHLMEQYRPTYKVGQNDLRANKEIAKYEEIDRPIVDSEYDKVMKVATQYGLWRFEDNIWLSTPR